MSLPLGGIAPHHAALSQPIVGQSHVAWVRERSHQAVAAGWEARDVSRGRGKSPAGLPQACSIHVRSQQQQQMQQMQQMQMQMQAKDNAR